MSWSSSRKRRAWLAALLCLPSPFFGMLYLGRGLRALTYLFATLLGPYAAYALAGHGLWPAGFSWLLLPLALTVVGVLDAYRIASRYRRRFSGPWFTTWHGLLGLSLATVVVMLVVRSYAFEPLLIPSESMVPTLLERDQILVDKRAYRSIAIPFASMELRAGARPRRGDVVIFRPRKDPAVEHVKRIVGLPGDLVVYETDTKRLRIDGALVEAVFLGPYEGDAARQVVREVLDGREHRIVLDRRHRGLGGTYPVPEGHYFVLGDNRDNSLDSRYAAIEYVAEEAIDGKVVLVWWNTRMPERAGTVPR